MDENDLRYVIFVDPGDGAEVMMAAPLKDEDRAYLLNRVVPTLRPMTDEQYIHGPFVILSTMARFSYVLHGQCLYWCIEWEPGLLVLRFSADGKIDWTAVRSPIPEFGGRTPDPDDDPDYDEDAVNPQYNLVFIPWDAQFDADKRKRHAFEPAGDDMRASYDAALAHVESLGERAEALYADKRKLASWMDACKKNLKDWAGKGLRLPA